jgi:hypothetical protein
MEANANKCINLGVVQTLTAQAAGTVVTGDLDTRQAIGALVFINVTAVTGSLTVSLKGKDEASGTYYTIIASPAIASTGMTVLRVYPGLTASANATVNDVTPVGCQISSVVATGPATATISMQLIY